MSARYEYTGRVFEQGGAQVVRVDGRNKKWVEREIAHYVLMYSQDGPVRSQITRRKLRSKIK